MMAGAFTNGDATVVRGDDTLLGDFIDPLSEAEKIGPFTGVDPSGFNEFTVTGLNYVLVLPADLAPHSMASISISNGV
ncbi:MAG: hypothetical protein V3V05_04690 [Pontiella sp.]